MNTYTRPTLVPISIILKTSWHHLVAAFSILFRLLLVRWILEAMLLGFCISIFGTLGFSSLVSHSMVDQTVGTSYISSFTALNTGMFLISIGFVLILYGILACVLQIATIFAVSKQNRTASLTTIFHLSFPKFLPFLFSQLLCFLLIAGGFFAFLLPGIGMLLFFTFVPFVVIFEGKSGLSAIARSVTLIAAHPLSLIGRFLLLWLAGCALNIFLYSGVFQSVGFGIHILLVACSNMIFWWYSTTYIYLLYKETGEKLQNKKMQSLRPLVALSLCGWGIGIFVSIALYSFLSTLDLKQFFHIRSSIPNQAQYSPKYQYDMSFGTKEI